MKIFFVILALSLGACASKSVSPSNSSVETSAPAQTNAKTNTESSTAQETVANKKNEVAPSRTTCTYDETTRDISITRQGSECKVFYTKDGSSVEIGSGSAQSKLCKEIAARVKNNLVAAGYSCQ